MLTVLRLFANNETVETMRILEMVTLGAKPNHLMVHSDSGEKDEPRGKLPFLFELRSKLSPNAFCKKLINLIFDPSTKKPLLQIAPYRDVKN